MRPTEILSNEHRIIEVMLNCLERMAERSVAGGKLDRDDAEQAIDFIRNFADGCHHGKEEAHLFQTLASKGMPRDFGPIGVMLSEHEQGRAFVRAMAANIVKASEGEQSALQGFAAAANGYVQLLRAHIGKEDNILFPMAENILDDADRKNLHQAFGIVETEEMGDGTHGRYLTIARRLAAKYDVPAEATEDKSCGCGH
jgi:hemerythrin-like domain-containing protein